MGDSNPFCGLFCKPLPPTPAPPHPPPPIPVFYTEPWPTHCMVPWQDLTAQSDTNLWAKYMRNFKGKVLSSEKTSQFFQENFALLWVAAQCCLKWNCNQILQAAASAKHLKNFKRNSASFDICETSQGCSAHLKIWFTALSVCIRMYRNSSADMCLITWRITFISSAPWSF